MPLFEFTCKNCKKEFEELLNNSDTSKVTCVKCGSKNVIKKMSAFGVKTGGNAASGHDCRGCCSRHETCSNHASSSCGH